MSKAFDTALFVGVPVHPADAVVVDVMGPPFTTKFSPVVTSPAPGVSVGASVPAANAPNQILVSASTAGNPWVLGTNPATAAVVPAPLAQNHVLLSDATPSWQDSTLAAMLAAGGAVTVTTGGTFNATSSIAFVAAASLTTRIDGGDPTKSMLDNFNLDCGTY